MLPEARSPPRGELAAPVKKYRFDSPPKEKELIASKHSLLDLDRDVLAAAASSSAKLQSEDLARKTGALVGPGTGTASFNPGLASLTAGISSANRKVYVGNLPPGLNMKSGLDLLNKTFVEYRVASLPGLPITNLWLSNDCSFGFVDLRTPEEASNVVKLNGKVIVQGHIIKFGRPRGFNEGLGSRELTSGTGPAGASGSIYSLPGKSLRLVTKEELRERKEPLEFSSSLEPVLGLVSSGSEMAGFNLIRESTENLGVKSVCARHKLYDIEEGSQSEGSELNGLEAPPVPLCAILCSCPDIASQKKLAAIVRKSFSPDEIALVDSIDGISLGVLGIDDCVDRKQFNVEHEKEKSLGTPKSFERPSQTLAIAGMIDEKDADSVVSVARERLVHECRALLQAHQMDPSRVRADYDETSHTFIVSGGPIEASSLIKRAMNGRKYLRTRELKVTYEGTSRNIEMAMTPRMTSLLRAPGSLVKFKPRIADWSVVSGMSGFIKSREGETEQRTSGHTDELSSIDPEPAFID